MKRLYYLTSTLTSVEAISNDLHSRGISDWRFHIVSKNETGLYTHQLHSANSLYRTDLVRFVERGVILGGLIGCSLIAPLAITNPFNLAMGAWLAISLFCILVGAWVGGIGGISSENYKIRRFNQSIEKGQYLIMIDLRKKDVEEMTTLMTQNHPEAILQGLDSTITNPLASPDGKVHII